MSVSSQLILVPEPRAADFGRLGLRCSPSSLHPLGPGTGLAQKIHHWTDEGTTAMMKTGCPPHPTACEHPK